MKRLKISAREKKVLQKVMRELGRRGGKASAAKLTAKQRSEKARKAGEQGGRGRTKKGGQQ
jgi:general stress protein YciG